MVLEAPETSIPLHLKNDGAAPSESGNIVGLAGKGGEFDPDLRLLIGLGTLELRESRREDGFTMMVIKLGWQWKGFELVGLLTWVSTRPWRRTTSADCC